MVSITAYRKPRLTHRGTGVTRTALKHLVESTGHALVNRLGHAIGSGYKLSGSGSVKRRTVRRHRFL